MFDFDIEIGGGLMAMNGYNYRQASLHPLHMTGQRRSLIVK